MKLSLQKYFNEHKMERTVESALIRHFTISPIRRFNIFVVNSIHLYCERDKFPHFYSPIRDDILVEKEQPQPPTSPVGAKLYVVPTALVFMGSIISTNMSCLRHFLRLNCELIRKFIRFTV